MRDRIFKRISVMTGTFFLGLFLVAGCGGGGGSGVEPKTSDPNAKKLEPKQANSGGGPAGGKKQTGPSTGSE